MFCIKVSQAAIQKQNCDKITWCNYNHVIRLRWFVSSEIISIRALNIYKESLMLNKIKKVILLCVVLSFIFMTIFQDVIAARQEDLEFDFNYNSFSFKLFSLIISNQFFEKFILDSFNDIDLFDLKVRSSFSLKSFNKSFDKHVSFK
jgi:hypothetical protein